MTFAVRGQASKAERREHQRVPYDGPVTAQPIPQGLMSRTCPMFAEDLSETGLRVSSPEFVELGSQLLVSLFKRVPKEEVRTVGTVVWAEKLDGKEGWRLGLSFDAPSPATTAEVRGLVNDQTQ